VRRSPAKSWTLGILLLGVCLICPEAEAVPDAKLRDLKQKAEAFAKQGDWEKACDLYELVLRARRDLPECKEGYIQCVRRLWQSRRHHDLSYRKEVLSIEYGQAVHLHGLVRDLLLDHSLERKKLDPAKLFRKGLEEFDLALADAYFCRQHIPAERIGKVAEFRAIVGKTWGDARPANRKEARNQLCEIALAAQSYLKLSATVVVMEFTCGACYALDEYTAYLTPSQLRDLCSSLRGELIGVGVTLAIQDNKVFIHRVDLGSPAAKAMLAANDQILSLDKKAVASLSIETVVGMLEGPAGSIVELEVQSPAMGMRTLSLRRDPAVLPSVTAWGMLPDSSAGYLRIGAFQDNTPKEVDDILARLSAANMKALVLDLRGNSGGLFDSAVEVARRFLSSGVIASKQQLDEKSNIVTVLSESKNPNALTLPVVALIDNETASAAEVLAGALKDNGRATLMGQPTYGKGCTQFLLKLPDFKGGLPAGGMRLTVAKVFSPKGLSYTGRGVLPDIFVNREAMQPEMTPGAYDDPLIAAAQLEIQRQLAMMPR
jgi:carboxyl-terminal processing protease